MTALEELGHLSDVPVALEAELDHKIMTLRDILNLEAGSVIKMTRSAGENILILTGGTLLGSGEIVVVDDSMGVRITDFKEEE
jgi:flagellar motor switch protein FliN/FliY